MSEFDKCIFCKKDLEDFGYHSSEENGERATSDDLDKLNICKFCVKILKNILNTNQGDDKNE